MRVCQLCARDGEKTPDCSYCEALEHLHEPEGGSEHIPDRPTSSEAQKESYRLGMRFE